MRFATSRFPLLLALILSLAACGGSGSSDTGTTNSTGNGTPTPTPTPAVDTTGISCGIANHAQAMLDAVNQARATGRYCGTDWYPATAALTWNAQLAEAALAHSNDMATNNYFSHTSQDGRTFVQRITATGYSYSTLGENIAAGYTDVTVVVDSWLQSAGHCANIMNASFQNLGAACARNDASAYVTYWTQDFGRP